MGKEGGDSTAAERTKLAQIDSLVSFDSFECSSQEILAYFTVSTPPVPYGFWEAESL